MRSAEAPRVVERADEAAIVAGIAGRGNSRSDVGIVRQGERPRHCRTSRRLALSCIVLGMTASLGACAMGGGVVRIRHGAGDGQLTVEDMQQNVDTLVRSACQRIVGNAPKLSGTAAVSVVQDPQELETRAKVTRSSGDLYMDEVLADLASMLAPRYRETAMREYNPRYDVSVHYSCARDAYGVTGVAAVEL